MPPSRPDDRTPGDRAAGRRAITGATVFLVCGRAARRGLVGHTEARCFHLVNDLPGALLPPVWTLMQAGSLGGVVATSAAAMALQRPRLALRLLVAGSTTWVAAKVLKRFVRRGRPSETLPQLQVRGRPQTGLGYPSGHAAVAATLATVVAPHLARPWRTLVWAVPAVTGAGRIYVGAHLPLDVAGGIGLGYAAGASARLGAARCQRQNRAGQAAP